MMRAPIPVIVLASLAAAGGLSACQTFRQPASAPVARSDLVTLSGMVRAVRGETFLLETGEGSIIVEHDDSDYFSENRATLGDQVTVRGVFDDNNASGERTFEAESVYIPRLLEDIFASSDDEEGEAG